MAGATCTLSNDAGKWFVKTPGSVKVQKSTKDLTVECVKNEAAGHENMVSKANINVWGNILLGGAIGYAIDRSSGAGFDYPESVTVKLGASNQNIPFVTDARKTIASGTWKAVMACSANRFRQDRPPYQANFSAEVKGDKVVLHRKNAVIEEVLSGTVVDERLVLNGMGYRLKEQNVPWLFKFTGTFIGNGKIYSANGDMFIKGDRSVRSCTLIMIHTDVDASVKEDAGEDAQTNNR